MGRSFAGGASTDRVDFGAETYSAARTFSVWFYLTATDGTDRRFFEWANGTDLVVNPRTNSTRMAVGVGFTTTNGDWSVPIPGTGAWKHLLITMAGVDSNDNPFIYFDNSSQTVTELTTPSGSYDTATANLFFGNNAATNRAFNGYLAEFGMWNRVLTADERASLSKGFAPTCIRNGLIKYIPLNGESTTENDYAAGTNGTVTGATRIPGPAIIYPSN